MIHQGEKPQREKRERERERETSDFRLQILYFPTVTTFSTNANFQAGRWAKNNTRKIFHIT